MQNKKRIKWALFAVSVLTVCFMVQLKLQAENADTFISPECVAYCEEIGRQYAICPELLEAIILLAADYLSELFLEYGDMGTVLMLYNGSRNALKRGEQGDYTEYAQKIMKRSEQLERLHQK